MTAADLMTPDVESVDVSAPVTEAAVRLSSRHLGRLVSTADVLAEVVAPGSPWLDA